MKLGHAILAFYLRNDIKEGSPKEFFLDESSLVLPINALDDYLNEECKQITEYEIEFSITSTHKITLIPF